MSSDPEPPDDVPLLRQWTGDMDSAESLSLGGAELVVFTTRWREAERPNQDAVALVVLDDERLVLAVADGAGGQPAGDRASEAAIATFGKTVQEVVADGLPLREAVLQGFDRANAAVLELGVGAATTLVVAVLEGTTLRTYHAGDSRALVCSPEGLVELLTAAHSPVGHAVQAGVLEEEEALYHEQLYLVSNVVGDEGMLVEIGAPLELGDCDTVLLASDGVFDNLDPGEIVEQLHEGPLAEVVEALMTATDQRMTGQDPDAPSKPDDVSLIALRRSP